jgi:thiamine biosynthesis lipoprotein ApbE
VNPRTGYPVEGTRTVSVKAVSGSLAETLSTALLAGNDRQKKQIIKNFRDIEAVEINYNQELQAKITRIT